jgi:acyl-CoA hydrolase
VGLLDFDMTCTHTLADGVARLAAKAKGGRVFLPGGPIEPLALAEAFREQPDLTAGLTFCGMMIPGINTTDWAALHCDARAEVFLPSQDLTATIKDGRTRVLPLHYSAAYRYLITAPFTAAVFHVCPPDREGQCNLSLSADSSPAFFDRDVFKLALINHGLPRIAGAGSIPISLFDAIIEIDQPPLAIEIASPSQDASAIAGHVAALVADGATVQAGIGKLPSAVMAALAEHRDLKLHSGLIGDWALELMKAGAFSRTDKALTAGVILGSKRLHAALANDPRVNLQPISHTHGAAHLAGIDGFTSINAALEIDLFGQINCEFAGTRAITGVGGAVDYLRGARASKGGKAIVMIASEGKGGVSRIVQRLTTPSVSIARTDAPILVTEQGAVDLEPLDANARARAIISLAAPAHREALTDALSGLTL